MTIKIYSGKGSQKRCYEENKDKTFFLSLDKRLNTDKGKTKTYLAFKDIDAFYEWRRSDEGKKYDANFYEIIKEGCPCIEYYDIDAYTSLPGPYHNLTEDEIVESFINARMEYHIEMLGDYNIPLRRGDFYITSTPGKDKVSLHIYIRNGFMFKNNNIHLKTFVKDFKKYCEIENLPVEIDDSVYSKNRAFRLINNYKIGQKDRVCVAYNNKNKRKKDFLAVNVEGITKYYFEKEIITETKQDVKTINEIYKDSKENKIFLLLTLIEDTIAHGISPLCDTEYKDKVNYKNFFNLAVALLNSCKETDKERVFNKAFALYRHADPADKEEQYNKLLHYNYEGISIKSIHYWARFSEEYLNYFKKEDAEYREFENIRRYNWMKKKAFENRDKPVIKYGRELRSLTNKTKRRPPLLSTLERTLIKLIKYVYANGAECYFIDNEYYDLKEGKRVCEYQYESRCNFMRQAIGKGSIAVNYINESYITARKDWLKELENPKLTEKQRLKLETREPKKVNSCILQTIIDSLLQDGKLKQYTNLTFMPYLYKDISQDNLNLFRGYTYKVRDKPKIKTYMKSKFRKNITKYLCNNDKNFADWFEKWIAHAIQKPMEKCTVMAVFVGAQGTGKDLLYGALRHIIGRRYTGELTGMEPLFDRFNGCLDRKLFIRMNEIKTKGKQFANAGKLKDIIDRRFITIEQKYKEKYESMQVVRFLAFSNEEDILVLDKDDRRFSIINTNDEKAQNKEYFKSIVAELNEEFYKSMFDYYATLDISDFLPLKPCDSKFKVEQKKYNEPKPILMLLDWYKEGENKEAVKTYTLKHILNNQWLMWCHNTHYTKALDMGYITFNKHIKKILPVKPNKERVLSVSFNYEMLRDGFRKYYKDESFEL
jgi:hypothetical protein